MYIYKHIYIHVFAGRQKYLKLAPATKHTEKPRASHAGCRVTTCPYLIAILDPKKEKLLLVQQVTCELAKSQLSALYLIKNVVTKNI